MNAEFLKNFDRNLGQKRDLKTESPLNADKKENCKSNIKKSNMHIGELKNCDSS